MELVIVLSPFVLFLGVAVWFTTRRRREDLEATLQEMHAEVEMLRCSVDGLSVRVIRLEASGRDVASAPRGPVAAREDVLPAIFSPDDSLSSAGTLPSPAGIVLPRVDVPASLSQDIAPSSAPPAVAARAPVLDAEPASVLAADSESSVAPEIIAASESIVVADPASATPNEDHHGRLSSLGANEIEALVGGNWLNKLGVAVFVIGVSLFLGYSLTRVGPAGRVTIAWVVSLLMLAGGIAAARRTTYRLFGFGLLAGGWAGAYFTAFAMYGLPAAHVIDSPILASGLLLAVAAGMIGHGLRFRSPIVTGLAYAIGFATLNIAPSSSFSLFASVPLAASLIVVTHRFGWVPLGTLGVILAYGSFLIRMLVSTEPATFHNLMVAQATAGLYWLLFEAFQLLDLRQSGRQSPARAMFPLNATGVIGVSLLLWLDESQQSLYTALAAISLAYLASAVIRARLSAATRSDDDESEQEAILSGGYEGAIAASVGLAFAASALRFSGAPFAAALLVQGQLLVAAGLRLRARFLRGLGSVILTGAFTVLAVIALGTDAHVNAWAGLTWHAWHPVALLLIVACYFNWTQCYESSVWLESFYAAFATATLAVSIGRAVPASLLGTSWFLTAIALSWVSRSEFGRELRRHAYFMFGAGVVAATVNMGMAWPYRLGAACTAWAATALMWRWAENVDVDERLNARRACSWAGTVLAAIALWDALPAQYAALGALVLAWGLAEVGVRAWSESLSQAVAVAAVGVFDIVLAAELGVRGAVLPVPLVGGAAALTALATGRFYSCKDDDASCAVLPRAGAIVSVVLTMLLAWHALPTTAVALAWGALALVLLQLGASTRWTLLTDIAYTAAAVTFARLLVANFAVFGDVFGLSVRLLTVVPSIGLFLYLSVRALEDPGRYARSASRAFLWMAACLVIALIRFELGRVFAAVGWSLTVVVLLAVAKWWRPVDLRAQAYTVGALTFVRAWTTNLQTMPVSGTVATEMLAAVVVAVCLYAAEFLAPRGQEASDSPGSSLFAWIDSHAHEGFSIAATFLLVSVMFHNVSASLLTVVWAFLGLSLLVVGFAAREAVLRRSGLVLLAVCIVKVLAYDSRQLETVSRIFSFILLGLVLMIVSYLYTRFATALRKYL